MSRWTPDECHLKQPACKITQHIQSSFVQKKCGIDVSELVQWALSPTAPSNKRLLCNEIMRYTALDYRYSSYIGFQYYIVIPSERLPQRDICYQPNDYCKSIQVSLERVCSLLLYLSKVASIHSFIRSVNQNVKLWISSLKSIPIIHIYICQIIFLYFTVYLLNTFTSPSLC